ncbi:MAG: rRNA pseudouridine synthase [Deltaproteobacteria bacterium]|nr:rRNA pseudouridine synthase [Deltaproteobacteria bacterium]
MAKRDPSEVRLAKLMARRGVASRRECEEFIRSGRVMVNGKVIDHPAFFADPRADDVRVDNKPLPPAPAPVYLLMYKPRGCITSRDDPQERKSVFDLLGDRSEKVEPVGRLDFDTEGALLLTNDGDLAHLLTHPSRDVPKRYLAKVYRTPGAKDLRALEQGVYLDDGRTKPARVRVLDRTGKGNAWVEITVSEGRNRLVRRMLAQLGHPVSKLRRESFATLSIRGMERGQVRRLTPKEVLRLQEIAQGTKPSRAGKVRRGKGFARPRPKQTRPRSRRSGSKR